MSAIFNRPIPDAGPSYPTAPSRDNPRYEEVANGLVASDATQAQRDHAYDLVADVEKRDQVCYTDEALTQEAAKSLAADGTVPLNVSQVAPLVPPGTALGPFASADEAAAAMMEYSNPLSIEAVRENGGLVLRNPDTGDFYVTTPMPGTVAGFDPGDVPVPDGMEIAAAYHGHGDYSTTDGQRTDKEHDEYLSDEFSPQDKAYAEGGYSGPVIYVSTPNGDFRKYDSATNQDTKIN